MCKTIYVNCMYIYGLCGSNIHFCPFFLQLMVHKVHEHVMFKSLAHEVVECAREVLVICGIENMPTRLG